MTRSTVALLALALAGCVAKSPASDSFRLYRASLNAGDPPLLVATFDAPEGDEYNRENCATAQGLFSSQPGVTVRYWCEKV